MSERPRAIAGGLTLLLALTAPAAAGMLPSSSDSPAAAEVRERLAALLAELPKSTEVGLAVAATDDGASWFAHQPRRPLKPASVMKLFVTAAALERFGPNFTYKTRVYTRNGELLVLGSGDPALGDERIARRRGRPLHGEFDVWAQTLKDRGLLTLSTIALDDTIFDPQWRHRDWPDAQAQKWYQAPVGGLNFNDNCLDARVKVSRGETTLILQPELPANFFVNALKSSSKHVPVADRSSDKDVFEFRGPVAHSDRFEPISVGRPTVFFGYALRRALEKRGIAVRADIVRRDITPATLAGAELLDVRTTPLRDVLWRANTFSQNLFAECLLKSLAAYNTDGTRSREAGSWASGVRVLEATLRELGLDLEGAAFRDGSGLSHQNRVTAQQVVQLLVIMQRHSHSRFFVESLAKPGEDGTMRRRYAAPALRGRMRGKTGTLSGVRTLAGYISRADGTTLAFALLVNGSAPRTFSARVAEVLATAGTDRR